MLQQAAQQRALAPESHPQTVRLRSIARRLIPHVMAANLKSTPRAAQWKWEVNLIGSKQVNAFCMPGGKIAFFYGLLDQLKLNDDEVAMVMGHEIAHALREHARERMGKTAATNGLIELGSALLGLGSGGRYLANMGGQLLTLRFSREDESEAAPQSPCGRRWSRPVAAPRRNGSPPTRPAPPASRTCRPACPRWSRSMREPTSRPSASDRPRRARRGRT